ncbi:hypothetical protein Clacol_000048 [Clathrus columnatus]|uniref:Lysophospholipase n=1 Tax=Clathrus columnatus TaxID=1419009 RepID=A0AAV4ZYR3_9AGAM|nr:hypothetical protein Clacol_000048 [Clathrus columnatus]
MASSTNPYAPRVNVQCPSNNSEIFRTFFPQNQTLHPEEQAYVQGRQPQILDAWRSWIQGPEIGYNMSQFQSDSYPSVGMAISGGGFRASLFGAGVLNAYDARNTTAKALGTGGLYNVATYVAGASGGSWAVASQLFNPGAESYYDLVLGGGNGDEQGWLLDINVAFPNGDNFLDSKNEEFYGAIVANAKAKGETSLPISVTDIWAGLLSYHFLNGTTRDNFFTTTNATHGAGILWSDIPNSPLFQSRTIPFPVVISDSRSPSSDGERPSLEDVVYEISPFEFGSWDPTLSSMVNLKFAGTNLNEGTPANSTSCVTGFDQAAYIIGTSSNLWDSAAFILTSEAGSVTSLLGPLGDALDKLIAKIVSNGEDTALWPNPFAGLNKGVFLDALSTNLHLDDGGENAENVPIEPLMLKPRNVDVVVAIDSTAETTLGTKHNFPNGTAMNTAATRLRTILSKTHQQAPPIPPDFAITGNNLHVSFFGCDPTQDPPEFPLIIYVPNSPPCTGDSPVTNTGAFQLSYSAIHQQQFFNQTFLGATCGFVPNTTSIDINFPSCLKCAAIDRARLTTTPPIQRSAICQQCFDRYCFNPADPPSNKDFPGRQFILVDPTPSTLSKVQAFIQKHGVPLFVVLGIVLVLSFGLCGFCAYRRKKTREEKIQIVRKYGWGALAGVERLEASNKKRGFFNKFTFMKDFNRKGKYKHLNEEYDVSMTTPEPSSNEINGRSSWIVPKTPFSPKTVTPSNPFADMTPDGATHEHELADLPVLMKDYPAHAVGERVSSPMKYDDPYEDEEEFNPYK